MSKKQVEQATPVEYDVQTLETLPTTAAKIRYLTGLNMKRGRIAKVLGIRYQWVRNVQITPVKK